MEIFGSVEAEVIHILVPADAVHIVVELNLGGVLPEELDIYLVPRVGLAGMRVGIVVARAGEEGACRARLCRGLHAYFIVAVAEILVRARFAAEIFGARLFAAVGVVGDGQLHRAVVGVSEVICAPLAVEHACVRPAVGGEYPVGRALGPVGDHVVFKRLVGEVLSLTCRAAGGKHHGACRKRCRQRESRQKVQQLFSHKVFSL